MNVNNIFLVLLICAVGLTNSFSQTPSGMVEIGQRLKIPSKFKDYTYDISVYLPIHYNRDSADKQKRYPVLYLFIGWDHMFHAATGVAGLLGDFQEIPEMIVVGITNIDWWHDLTPQNVVDHQGLTGGASNFLKFVSEQLFPYVEGNYKTTDHRLFMGHSLGGLFGVYTLLDDPGRFTDYVLLSPSIEDRANSLYPKLNELMASEQELSNDIYMIVGSEGNRMNRGIFKLATAFSRRNGRGFRWELERREDLNHFTIVLPGMINGLKFVAKKELSSQ